jgi:hypothetical protein
MRSRRVKVAEIAVQLGRSENAIHSFLRYIPAGKDGPPRMGSTPPLPPKPPKPEDRYHWSADDIRTMRSLAEEGASAREAADVLGRQLRAVTTKAGRLGISFCSTRRHSIYRLEQETERFNRNAIDGSEQLRVAILTALAA